MTFDDMCKIFTFMPDVRNELSFNDPFLYHRKIVTLVEAQMLWIVWTD